MQHFDKGCRHVACLFSRAGFLATFQLGWFGCWCLIPCFVGFIQHCDKGCQHVVVSHDLFRFSGQVPGSDPAQVGRIPGRSAGVPVVWPVLFAVLRQFIFHLLLA